MIGNNSDKAWKYYGENDPYYGVLTHDIFAHENIEKYKEDFFLDGRLYISEVIANVRKHFSNEFKPAVAADFGCGVGRLTIPLSDFSEKVYGIDISEGMLKEARINSNGKTNIEFVLSDDNLSLLPQNLDMVHSYIVFQHIPVDRGMHIAKMLINRLNPGGIGVLHFTYAIPGEKTEVKRIIRLLFRIFPVLYSIKAKIKKQRGPMMQMNEYSLSAISKLIQEAGANEIFISLTNHNFYGATFYFKKG